MTKDEFAKQIGLTPNVSCKNCKFFKSVGYNRARGNGRCDKWSIGETEELIFFIPKDMKCDFHQLKGKKLSSNSWAHLNGAWMDGSTPLDILKLRTKLIAAQEEKEKEKSAV